MLDENFEFWFLDEDAYEVGDEVWYRQRELDAAMSLFLRPRARSHDLELILENLPEPLLVQSDSIRLEQVLGNTLEG